MVVERDEERIERLTGALKAADLDALCCRLPHNVLLLTGYWPMLGTATALITREGEIMLIFPADERDLAERGWVDDDRLVPFTPVTLDHMGNADDATRPLIAEAARRLKLARAAIGYEGDAALIPAPYVALHSGCPGTSALYQGVLPDADFWDASPLLAEQRAILTDRERAIVAHACVIAGHGFEAAATAIRVGTTEAEVAAAVAGAITVNGLSDSAVQRADAHAFCMSGPRAGDAFRAYARTAGRALRMGDLVLVHVNSSVDGFWTDLTRTYVLGEPDHHQLTMYEAVLEARGRALRAIGDGAAASAVDAAARDHLTRAGFGDAFKHQLGHGVGYGAIYHGNRPRLHPCSDDVLRKGMAFNVEPAVYIEGVSGLRHCDVVTVMSAGAQVLSPFHSGLDDLIIAHA
jgi:Xaa-Pro dipeptidase